MRGQLQNIEGQDYSQSNLDAVPNIDFYLNRMSDLMNNPVIEEYLSHFECPVCYERMAPPIHQCVEGHVICNPCFLRLIICPKCRSKFSEFRCKAMETLYKNVILPCKNYSKGCKFIGPGDVHIGHESNCEFGDK
ncbi:hypothetical protein WA026_017113 [Henosepilachna vigintioctopunctata]|uniref:RING-type domain-containing protein n=1 Tax=Henosepilachna vigintioctopunctata TaxID=420089 RepID=A0AAW1TUE9_9CUCU